MTQVNDPDIEIGTPAPRTAPAVENDPDVEVGVPQQAQAAPPVSATTPWQPGDSMAKLQARMAMRGLLTAHQDAARQYFGGPDQRSTIDEALVEKQVQAAIPVVDDVERYKELAFDRLVQNHPELVQEGNDPWATIASGAGRGLVGLGEGIAFLPYLAEKIAMVTPDMVERGINMMAGKQVLDTQAAYKWHDATQDFLEKMKGLFPSYSDTETATVDAGPKVGKVTVGTEPSMLNPMRILGGVSEMAPTVAAALLTSGFADSAGLLRGLSSAEALVAKGEITAGAFAALQAQGNYEGIRQVAKAKGVSPDTADNLGLIGALALLPANYVINTKFLPAAKFADERYLGHTMLGQLAASALDQGIQGASSVAALNTAKNILTVGDTIDFSKSWIPDLDITAAQREFLHDPTMSFLDGAVMGLPFGLAFHGLQAGQAQDNPATAMHQALRDKLGRDTDVATFRDLYTTFTREFGVDRAGADELTNLFKHGFAIAGAKDGLTAEQALMGMYARKSEQEDASQRILFQPSSNVVDENGFFSKLRNVVLDKLPAKGELPADQILWTLTNSGVKADEMEWTGMKGMLEAAGNDGVRLSRSEIANFLDRNQVRLSFIEKGDAGQSTADVQQKFRDFEKAQLELSSIRQKFEKAQTSDNPDELLDQLQTAKRNYEITSQDYQSAQKSYRNSKATKYDFVRPDGPSTGYQEWLLKFPQPPMTQEDVDQSFSSMDKVGQEKKKFSSAHWEEPNVLVHMRVDERTDPTTGKKYLHLIEVQSDWHQEGRREGYRGVTPPKQNEVGFNEQPEPAPFSKTWNKLAMKKLLIEAVKRGYDRIAWSPGFMQDRFQGSGEPGRAKFYDEVIPNALMEIVRKLDKGAKLSTVIMDPGVVDPSSPVRMSGDKASPVEIPSLEITPAIRDSVLGGLPLFQKQTLQDAVSSSLRPKTEGVRAIRLEDGSFVAGSFPQHENLAQAAGVEAGKAKDTGYIIQGKDGLEYKTDGGGLEFIGGKSKENPVRETVPVSEDQTTLVQNSRPNKRDSLLNFFLRSENRASFIMLASGRSFIEGLQNPDYGSALHEIAHFARNYFLDSDNLATVERMMDVQDGRWTTANEEKFVDWMQLALRAGRSPIPELTKTFDNVSEYLKKAYPVLDANGRALSMNPELRQSIESMFALDREPVIEQKKQVVSAWTEYQQAEQKHQKLAKDTQALDAEDAVKKLQETVLSGKDRSEKKLIWEQAEAKLQHLRDQDYGSTTSSYAEQRRGQRDEYMTAAKILDTNEYEKFKGGLVSKARSVFESVIKGLENTSGAQMLRDYGLRIFTTRNDYRAKLFPVFKATDALLTSEDRNWLKQDTGGYTNAQRLLDGKNPGPDGAVEAPNERIKQWAQGAYEIQANGQREARAVGQQRRLPSGDIVTAKEQYETYFPRLVTVEFLKMIIDGGPQAQRFLAQLAKDNPSLSKETISGWMMEDASSALGKDISKALVTTSRRGAMELSRKIENIPATFEGMNVFHNDPATMLSLIVDKDARRIATAKWAGWNVLENKYMDEGVIKRTLRQFGISTEFTKDQQIEKMVETGMFDADILGKQKMAELKKMAEGVGVPTGHTVEDLWSQLDPLAPSDLPQEKLAGREEAIREIAREVKGVDSKAPLTEVLAGIKERLSRNIDDSILNTIVRSHVGAGGKAKDVIDVWKIMQGYPLLSVEGSPILEALRLGTAVNGILQTSLAPVKEIFRSLRGGPGAVGLGNYLKAVLETASDPRSAIQQARDSGVFRDQVYTYGSDSSSKLSAAYHFIRDMSDQNMFAPIRKISDGIMTVAAKNFMDDVRSKLADGQKISPIELYRMRKAGFDALDLKHLKEGKLDQDTYNKVVQGIVYTSIGTNTPEILQAYAELHPALRQGLAYQRYTYSEARRLALEVHEIKQVFQKDGLKAMAGPQFRNGIYGLLTYAAAAVGANTLMQMMIGQIKGSPAKPQDDGWWSTITGGIIESTILSQLNSVAEPWKYANSGEDVILGYLPHLKALASLVEWSMQLLNDFTRSPQVGRYGKFPLLERTGLELEDNTPAVKAMLHKMEVVNYPQKKDYEDTRVKVNHWEAQTLGQNSAAYADVPINPQYQPAFQAASRGDGPGLQQAVSGFLITQMKQGIDSDVAMRNLRASLNSRRPIPLSEDDTMKFIMSLPLKDRQKAWMENARYQGLVDAVTGQ